MPVALPPDVCAALDSLRAQGMDLLDVEGVHQALAAVKGKGVVSDWMRSHNAAYIRAAHEGYTPNVDGDGRPVPCTHEWVEAEAKHLSEEAIAGAGGRRCELCNLVEERPSERLHAHAYVPVTSADGSVVATICSVCHAPLPQPHQAAPGLLL